MKMYCGLCDWQKLAITACESSFRCDDFHLSNIDVTIIHSIWIKHLLWLIFFFLFFFFFYVYSSPITISLFFCSLYSAPFDVRTIKTINRWKQMMRGQCHMRHVIENFSILNVFSTNHEHSLSLLKIDYGRVCFFRCSWWYQSSVNLN